MLFLNSYNIDIKSQYENDALLYKTGDCKLHQNTGWIKRSNVNLTRFIFLPVIGT